MVSCSCEQVFLIAEAGLIPRGWIASDFYMREGEKLSDFNLNLLGS